MPSPRIQTVAALAVAVTALVVYLVTLNPRLQFGDAPELAAAAHVLGIPHATGYPLYMLLLKVFTLLPIGEVITRTTIASAVCMALACAMACLTLAPLIRCTLPAWQLSSVVAVSAAGGLATAFLFDMWNQATQTEVYALQFLLTITFCRAAQVYLSGKGSGALAAAGLVCGLGIAHHRLSVCLAAGLVYLSLMHLADRGQGTESGAGMWRQQRHRWAAVIMAWSVTMMCLALYAYLPLRARTSPPVNFGNPRTPVAVWEHVRGSAYFERFFLQSQYGQAFTPHEYVQFAANRCADLAGRMADMFAPFRFSLEYDTISDRWTPRPGWPARWAGLGVVLVAATGLVLLTRAWPAFAACLMVVAGLNCAVLFFYNIPDITDYVLFPLWTAAAAAGLAVLRGVDAVGRLTPHLRRPAAAGLAFLLPAALLTANADRCNRSGDMGAEHYSALIMPESKDIMPHGSILLVGGDNDHFTCLYRQVARGERTDVLVFSAPSISSPWYAEFFAPALRQKYRLRFARSLPLGPLAFVQQLADGIIDANLGRHEIFTSITDPDVLASLDRRYGLEAVAARPIEGLSPYLREVTATLYRIQPDRRKEGGT